MPTAIPDAALCVGCNYGLRGLTEFRCPECGRAFDPAQPLSINLGRPLDPFARAALRSMGRLPRVAMWTLVVTGIIGPAFLVPDEQVACYWLLLWLAFFLLCWLRSTARVCVVSLYRQQRVLLRVDDPFRRKVRLAFAISMLLVLTRLPFMLAVFASRPWLDRYAYHVWAEIPSTAPLAEGPFACGLVVVRDIRVRGVDVTFRFYGGGAVRYVPTKDGQRLRLDRWSLFPSHSRRGLG